MLLVEHYYSVVKKDNDQKQLWQMKVYKLGLKSITCSSNCCTCQTYSCVYSYSTSTENNLMVLMQDIPTKRNSIVSRHRERVLLTFDRLGR